MNNDPGYFHPSPTRFRSARTGRWMTCRVETFDWDDPITIQSSCGDELIADLERRDVADGCPACLERRMP
jgi:hypothetical protein